MSIANEISKLQQNLLDCYDVCADNGAYLPEDINFDNLAACIEQISNPFNKPSDWSDIRTDCPANSIALYAGHTTDYSSYDNLGFTATCTGGYNVFIDGTQYGSTYASGSKCSITWSTSGITTGDDITTPSVLKAHKIWIEPATEGNNITAFHCARVAASGNEQQGILWAHFNLSNVININSLLNNESNNLSGSLCMAITAKNNKIICSGAYCSFRQAFNLEYVPILEANSSEPKNLFQLLQYNNKLKDITLKNFRNTNDTTGGVSYNMFQNSSIENIKGNWICTPCSEMFSGCKKLKKLPLIDASQSKSMVNFLTNAIALEDTVLDVRDATELKKIGCYGTSQYFMSGFKGLRVSNEAPFDNATAPQINVSYTGMDRNALVQLFEDLPYNVGYTVVGSPTIVDGVVSNFTTSNYLTLPEIDLSSPFEIMFKIKTPATWGSAYDVIIGGAVTRFVVQKDGPNHHLQYYIPDVGGSSRTQYNGAYTLSADTVYYIKVLFTGTQLTVAISLDKITWATEVSLERSIGMFSAAYSLGRSYTNPQQQWTGSIDLNETYIKVNDVYLFRGQPAMTKTLSCVGCTGNQNKITIVGSPTIENGVVSGFSSSNYVQISQKLDFTKNNECVFKFTTPSSWNKGSLQYVFDSNLFFYCTSSGALRYGWKGTDSTWPDYGLYDILDNSTTYYVKFSNNSNELIVSLSTNGTDYNNTQTRDISNLNNDFVNYIRFSYNTENYWEGTIDLNETYIKVNNELWFGREQYLLPEDKDIALNKGWSLTLS